MLRAFEAPFVSTGGVIAKVVVDISLEPDLDLDLDLEKELALAFSKDYIREVTSSIRRPEFSGVVLTLTAPTTDGCRRTAAADPTSEQPARI